jgi:hypothetical protein
MNALSDCELARAAGVFEARDDLLRFRALGRAA